VRCSLASLAAVQRPRGCRRAPRAPSASAAPSAPASAGFGERAPRAAKPRCGLRLRSSRRQMPVRGSRTARASLQRPRGCRRTPRPAPGSAKPRPASGAAAASGGGSGGAVTGAAVLPALRSPRPHPAPPPGPHPPSTSSPRCGRPEPRHPAVATVGARCVPAGRSAGRRGGNGDG